MVYDALLGEGFDAKRVTLGPVKQTQTSLDVVPLEFTLTVFGETPAEAPAQAPADSLTPNEG